MTTGLKPGAQGFDPGATAYEQSRPSYPSDAVAWMVDRLQIGPTSRVVDLAAGTGKFTRLLRGRVVAVEPYEGLTPREWRRRWLRPEWTDTGFTALEEAEFSYEQELDADGLCGRVASVSFIAALEQSERDELLGRVRDLVAGFAAPFVLPYRTAVYWCSKRS